MEYELPIDYTQLHWYERKAVREQYVREQGNMCVYCKCSLSEDAPKSVTEKNVNWKLFPDGFMKHPVHLQHDHNTGMTEGAVHNYCNAVMWQYDGR